MLATIRARLVLLVMLALVPAVAIIAYDEYLFREQVFRRIQEDAFRVVSLAGQRVQVHADETARRCRLLERFPEIQAMDASSRPLLADILREAPLYTSLALVDMTGLVVASAPAFEGELRVGDRALFKATVATGEFSTGQVGMNPLTPQPGLNMGCPVKDSNGTMRGVLWASLGLGWTADLVAGERLPQGAVLLVVDRNGVVLARSVDSKNWVGRNINRSDLFQKLKRQRSGMLTGVGADGVERLYSFVPIQVGNGEANAFAAIGIPTATASAAARASLFRNLGILSLGALACLAIAWLMAEHLFLRETRALLRTARQLETGNLAARTGLPQGPGELLEVARALDTGLAGLEKARDAIREARAREMRIAREIQMGILPADLAAATRGTGLDVHAVIEPAREVGGDLYEVLRVSDDRVVVALGDVSGKGIPASLFMAVSVTVLRTLARQFVEPDDILRRLNDELAEQNPRGMFVTLQCLVFDLAKGRVSCAGAGHHQLAILSPGCPPRLAFPSTGRPAGLMPFNPVESESAALAAGDTFVLYSDGVSEAMDPAEDFYGEERLLAELARLGDAGPKAIVDGVLESVRSFAAGAKQSDDITILAARYQGPR